ncbi:MAG: replication factor C large subunit [Deltaproteobacteria bacterium]|nr:replication factor C large subunit [Deltaproteobacteria bacterium]
MDARSLDWTEKYRPRSLDGIVGNKKAIETIKQWARRWSSGIPKEKKGLLIYGRPGTGKTTAALALAHDMGWSYLELNASDTRNYRTIREVLGGASTSSSLFGTGSRITLIILDEVDNMASRFDVGGWSSIIQFLEITRQPIVLIANDFWNGVVPNLKIPLGRFYKLCEVVQFYPPPYRAAKAYLINILKREGISFEEEAIDLILRKNIVENENVDLRGAIRDLQAVALGKKKITVKDAELVGWRDREANIFQTLGVIFTARNFKKAWLAALRVNMTPDELLEWLSENLPKIYVDPEDLALAFDFLSRADVFLGRSIRRQVYSLWAYATELMSGGVSIARRNTSAKGSWKITSSSWKKTYISIKGELDLIKSAAIKLRHVLHSGWKEFIREDLPYLRIICKKDPRVLASLIAFGNLTKEEAAAIVGEDINSPIIREAWELKSEIKDEIVKEVQKFKPKETKEEKAAKEEKTEKKIKPKTLFDI